MSMLLLLLMMMMMTMIDDDNVAQFLWHYNSPTLPCTSAKLRLQIPTLRSSSRKSRESWSLGKVLRV
jgi:hypothetical protein